MAGCAPDKPAAATASAAPSVAPAASLPSGVALCDPGREPGTVPSYPGWPVPGQAQMAAAIPILASSERVVGPNRFLFTFVDDQNQPLAAPEVPVEARFFDLAADPREPVLVVEGIHLDSGTGVGLYRTSVEFSCAGLWGVEFSVGLPAGESVPRTFFEVTPSSTTPGIGQQAPRSDSPVATTPEELAAISTDRQPDPSLYRHTIADAVTSGRPSVIFFGTPAFCQTAMCGPAIEHVKSIAAEYGERVIFVNVEPYRLQQTANGLQPLLGEEGQLQTVPAVEEWGLRTEPYLFVVYAGGLVSAKMEGPLDPQELRAEIEVALAEPRG